MRVFRVGQALFNPRKASADVLGRRWQFGNAQGDGRQPEERMPKQTKSQKIKAKLPCQWVEEEGFEVRPATPVPAKNPQVITDTSLLLKSNPPPRSTQFPTS
jgi:hypothetical protein